MYRALLIFTLTHGTTVFGQTPQRIYPLTIAGFVPGDTIHRQILINSLGIAEAVDDFGFEIVLRGKYIQDYSIQLFLKDSLVYSKKQIKGFIFPIELKECIRSSDSLFRLEITDVVLRPKGEKKRVIKGPTVFFVEY